MNAERIFDKLMKKFRHLFRKIGNDVTESILRKSFENYSRRKIRRQLMNFKHKIIMKMKIKIVLLHGFVSVQTTEILMN